MLESMEYLEKAIANCKTVSPYLSEAIAVTKRNHELCGKISWWKEGLWELIEEFLNSSPQDVDSELFIQGCALLGD